MINTDPATIVRNRTVSDTAEKERIVEIANSPEARQEKIKLAAAYRILARRGLDDGVAGHISLRVPGARITSGSIRSASCLARSRPRTWCWSTAKERSSKAGR